MPHRSHQQQQGRDGRGATKRSRRRVERRTAIAPMRREHRDPQHRRRAVGIAEHDDQQHAAERRAGQVRGVQAADSSRETR